MFACALLHDAYLLWCRGGGGAGGGPQNNSNITINLNSLEFAGVRGKNLRRKQTASPKGAVRRPCINPKVNDWSCHAGEVNRKLLT